MPNSLIILLSLLLTSAGPVFADPAPKVPPTTQAVAPQMTPPTSGESLQKGVERVAPARQGNSVQPKEGTRAIFDVLLFLVLAAGIIWGVKSVVGMVKSLSMNGLQKMRLKKFEDLSPMVIRSLKSLGTSLWGESRPWSTTFSIIPRSDRWILSDRRRNNFMFTVDEETRLEVSLRDTNLKVRVTLLNGARADRVYDCRDFSEQELGARLQEVRLMIAGQA